MSSDVWDDIIASKTTSKASDIAPPLPNVSNVPTFGADDNSVQDESYSTDKGVYSIESKGWAHNTESNKIKTKNTNLTWHYPTSP